MPQSAPIRNIPEENLIEVINTFRDDDDAIKVEVIFQEDGRYTVIAHLP